MQLAGLPGELVVVQTEQKGPSSHCEFLAKSLLTPATLELKRGAMVMFTVNRNVTGQSAPLYVNGQVGIVEDIWQDLVNVRRSDGDLIGVEKFVWRYDPRDENSATFVQYPLRLAWAMTIHKAQGLTLDAAYMDIRAAREPGQAYVAVSRVRTLAGLNFKDWFKGVHVSPEAINFYKGNNE